MRTFSIIFSILIICVVVSGCSVQMPKKWTAQEALVPDSFPVSDFVIDGDLNQAVTSSLEYLSKTNQQDFVFGKIVISKNRMLVALTALKDFVTKNPIKSEIVKYISKNFQFHRSAADKVLITGYYVPQLAGSLHKDSKYKYPLYSTPNDLVSITLDRTIKDKLSADTPVINRGRLEKGNVFVPYYSRGQIDSENVLSGRGLEIIYLQDPLERFFAHIQGSVHITLPDGSSVLAAYDNKNGHPYRPIGKRLIELGLLEKTNVTMDTIKSVLRQNQAIQEEVLNWNPSYVFFKLTKDLAKGSLNTPVIKDISIATDQTLFPKGAFGLLNINNQWKLIANHDTGGAIVGPGRVDFFFGEGAAAGQQASGLQQHGMVGFLSPKF